MTRVELRFYGDLNDFLPRADRGRTVAAAFPEPRSVKDLIEAQGVPHTEIDLIVANGEPVPFAYAVRDGDRVAVYPPFGNLDIAVVSRLGRPPLRSPRFVADVHLGKLVRRLRLLGFDCLYNPTWDDPALAARSAAEERVLLTRDRGLLMRAEVVHGLCLRSDQPEQQVRDVLCRLDLARLARPFSRCLACNGSVRDLPAAVARPLVPERTRQATDEYFRCQDCGKLYWKGAHWPRLQQLVRAALAPWPGQPPQSSGEMPSRMA